MSEASPPSKDEQTFIDKISVMEDLLRRMIQVQVSYAKIYKNLETKIINTESLVKGMRRDLDRIENKLATLDDHVTVPQQMAEMNATLEQISHQQEEMAKPLSDRTDPRLNVFVKPLIDVLKEEREEIEEMNRNNLSKLMNMVQSGENLSDEQISKMLENIGDGVKNCQDKFRQQQKAIQDVGVPFKEISDLFQANLRSIIQAHDMLIQLSSEFPNYLGEIYDTYHEHARTAETSSS
ncbi:hypothetical protein ACQZV8_16210 [Magnetococcales bacterium HHB-1]